MPLFQRPIFPIFHRNETACRPRAFRRMAARCGCEAISECTMPEARPTKELDFGYAGSQVKVKSDQAGNAYVEMFVEQNTPIAVNWKVADHQVAAHRDCWGRCYPGGTVQGGEYSHTLETNTVSLGTPNNRYYGLHYIGQQSAEYGNARVARIYLDGNVSSCKISVAGRTFNITKAALQGATAEGVTVDVERPTMTIPVEQPPARLEPSPTLEPPSLPSSPASPAPTELTVSIPKVAPTPPQTIPATVGASAEASTATAQPLAAATLVQQRETAEKTFRSIGASFNELRKDPEAATVLQAHHSALLAVKDGRLTLSYQGNNRDGLVETYVDISKHPKAKELIQGINELQRLATAVEPSDRRKVLQLQHKPVEGILALAYRSDDEKQGVVIMHDESRIPQWAKDVFTEGRRAAAQAPGDYGEKAVARSPLCFPVENHSRCVLSNGNFLADYNSWLFIFEPTCKSPSDPNSFGLFQFFNKRDFQFNSELEAVRQKERQPGLKQF